MTSDSAQLSVNPHHAQYLRTTFFASLDGLRCISIISVIAFHLAYSHLRVDQWGDKGVQLFFGISGFLITTLLLREQAKFGSISLKNFYIRRALRIFPLYYAVLLIYTVIIWKTQRHDPRGELFFHNLKFFATYTGNWFMDRSQTEVHFWLSWSLATEEQFYLVWPFVIFLAGRYWKIPVILMIAAAILGEVLQRLVGAGAVNFGTAGNAVATSIATPICLGSLLAYAMQHPRGFTVCWKVFGNTWSAPLAALALGLALYFEVQPDLVIYFLMVSLVASVCIREDHRLRRLLANPVMRYIGTISYGMYLLHMLVRGLTSVTLPKQPTLDLVATIVLTAAFASASYYLYERQFLKMKHAFSANQRPGPGAVRVIEEPLTAR